jgi:hypothetical protein
VQRQAVDAPARWLGSLLRRVVPRPFDRQLQNLDRLMHAQVDRLLSIHEVLIARVW